MPDKFVVNASPVILLAGVGGIDWIGRISPSPIIIPRAVVDEINAGPGGASLVGSLGDDSQFEIRNNIPVSPMVEGMEPWCRRITGACHERKGRDGGCSSR